MPANLTQQYLKVEEEYRRAATVEEELKYLQVMLQEMPKHKGTDNLQADMKAKIAKAKKEIRREEQRQEGAWGPHPAARGRNGRDPRAAPMPARASLSPASPGRRPRSPPIPSPRTSPSPAMMPWEDVNVQLIDTPPITDDFMDPLLQGLIRGGRPGPAAGRSGQRRRHRAMPGGGIV